MGGVRLTSNRLVCLLLLPCWGTVFSWCIHNAGAEVRSVDGFAPHSVTTSLLTTTFFPETKFRWNRLSHICNEKKIEINFKNDFKKSLFLCVIKKYIFSKTKVNKSKQWSHLSTLKDNIRKVPRNNCKKKGSIKNLKYQNSLSSSNKNIHV